MTDLYDLIQLDTTKRESKHTIRNLKYILMPDAKRRPKKIWILVETNSKVYCEMFFFLLVTSIVWTWSKQNKKQTKNPKNMFSLIMF